MLRRSAESFGSNKGAKLIPVSAWGLRVQVGCRVEWVFGVLGSFVLCFHRDHKGRILGVFSVSCSLSSRAPALVYE